MKERIKQLALECYNPYGNFDHNKFAELIINECISAVQNTSLAHAYTTFDLALIKGTIDKCVESIKTEFDIK